MNTRPTTTSLHLLGSYGTIHLDLFHGFCVVEPGDVSRWRKIIHPFDLAIRTLVAASTNLVRRILQGESAYPGLRNLTAQFYDAVEGKIPAPIGATDALAVASVRDLLMARRSASTDSRGTIPVKTP